MAGYLGNGRFDSRRAPCLSIAQPTTCKYGSLDADISFGFTVLLPAFIRYQVLGSWWRGAPSAGLCSHCLLLESVTDF